MEIQNGWILSVIFLGICYLPPIFSKRGRKRLYSFNWMSKKGKILSLIMTICFLAMLILPLFKPITDNAIQLYTGVFVLAIGILGTLISFHNYFTSAPDKLITKGLYGLSRNPIYVFVMVMAIGIAIMCSLYEMIPVFIIYRRRILLGNLWTGF